MHPEVRQDHQGACPLCGMALEPEMPTLDEGENTELADFRRRFVWTLPLTIAVAVLAMAGHRLQWFEMGTQSWIGLLAVSDPIKASAAEALAPLKASGIRVIMATGDGQTTAKAVAARLGITEFHGEVKPADKLALVEKLQGEGHVVAMAGDGINDAPALARADVGVAMGTGTDVAINSAQVTLVKGDLRGIAQARAISEETIANMRQNLGVAFVYNALGVPLAAGLLYPFTGWLLSPMIVALAMSLSSVSVISNALRLRGSRA